MFLSHLFRLWQLMTRKFSAAYSFAIRILAGQSQVQLDADAGANQDLAKLPAKWFLGSTACFFRVRPGVILKAPVAVLRDGSVRERPSVLENFHIERLILQRLGEHPLIVRYEESFTQFLAPANRAIRYHGWQTDFPTGLLFAEASHGSLQRFLDEHNGDIALNIRRKWMRQAIESVAYVHSRGIVHCDLRPDNFLVHGTGLSDLDLLLCDFGGSTCNELGILANSLPDAGFFDPNSDWTPSPAIDIFSLGSVLFTILTGHWPFREPGGLFSSIEEMEAYGDYVDDRFRKGSFPQVDDFWGGEIVLGCWTHKFSNVEEVMSKLDALSHD
jgi:serine/threonine protein kinase